MSDDECVSVSCPRCGLVFTDFVNAELQRKLDVAVEGFEKIAYGKVPMMQFQKIAYDVLEIIKREEKK
jgi:uncharacterized Zn finger protein